MRKTPVKSQANKGQFQNHPENINVDRSIDKQWFWREVFEREVMKEKEGKLKRELMAEAQVDKAIAGDTQAFNAVADRMEGKPTQQTDVTSGGEKIQGFTVDLVSEAKNKNS